MKSLPNDLFTKCNSYVIIEALSKSSQMTKANETDLENNRRKEFLFIS